MQLHPISPTRFSTSRAASLLSPDSHPPLWPYFLLVIFPCTSYPLFQHLFRWSLQHIVAPGSFSKWTLVEFFDAHFTQEIKINVETYAYVKTDFPCAGYYFYHKHKIKLSELEQELFFITFYIKNVTFIFFTMLYLQLDEL